jgi:phospholipid/cholesterol/gamma-HCH transport system substrate-binding protein
MDLTYKQEIGVGAIVLGGIALFVVGYFWLTGKSLAAGESTVDVVFTNVSGLKQGDPVFVSGVKKGRVARVNLDRVGRVTVTLGLSSDVRPRLDASAAVLSLDFFGAKFIDYNPGTKEELLDNGTVIMGASPPDVTDLASGMAARADELLGNASAMMSEQMAIDMRNTLIAMQRTLNIMSEIGSGPLAAQTTATMRRAEQVMTRFDSIMSSGTAQRFDSVSRNFAVLTEHMGQAAAALDTFMAKMNRGEGTFGRMATDTTLYKNMTETLTSMTALMKDLKERPGRYLTVKVF